MQCLNPQASFLGLSSIVTGKCGTFGLSSIVTGIDGTFEREIEHVILIWSSLHISTNNSIVPFNVTDIVLK